MVSVPPGTWEKESRQHTTPSSGNTTLSLRSEDEEEEDVDPPPRACLTLKVVYNKRWVNDAGKGDKELAKCEALAVVHEAEKIFNGRFAYIQYKRLGISVKFNLMNGGNLRNYRLLQFISPLNVVLRFSYFVECFEKIFYLRTPIRW